MKTKLKVITIFMLICISAIFCTNTFAASKTDIIGYVNSQSVCGDTALFNTYKKTFTRLLKQKKLTQSELNTIYSYLQNSVGILNSKGVCKIADLGKLTEKEKSSVYSSLTTAAGIITNAPLLQFGEEDETVNNNENSNNNNNNNNSSTNNTNTSTNNDSNTNTDKSENNSDLDGNEGTKITINTQDNTMDIYENGVLVDKVSMSSQKMTYTGVNITHVIIIALSTVVFVICLLTFIKLAEKHTAKTRFYKNMLVSLMICSSILAVVFGMFGGKIDELKAMVNLLRINTTGKEIQVELNADKSIKKYPSYASNYATLKIDKLDIENKVFYGDIASVLSLGVGHSTWSEMPTEDGVVVYSGHNREDMLNNLKDISIGDRIIVDTSYATCTYEVSQTKILKDYETDKLTKRGNNETLILYTCYPFDTYVYTNERFVVYSVLKETKWK